MIAAYPTRPTRRIGPPTRVQPPWSPGVGPVAAPPMPGSPTADPLLRRITEGPLGPPGRTSPTPGATPGAPAGFLGPPTRVQPPWSPGVGPVAAPPMPGSPTADPLLRRISESPLGPPGRTSPTPGATPGPPAGFLGPPTRVAPPQGALFLSRGSGMRAGRPGGGAGATTPPAIRLPDYDESQLDPLWSGGQINQLANRQVNQISTGAADAVRQLQEQLAGTGAVGALAERTSDIYANAGAQAAGARTEAELAAEQANAQHRLSQIAQLLQRRGQDIDLTSEMGRQQLSRYLGDLQASTTGRGQDIDWLAQQLSALTTQRGQDVAGRGQTLNYLLGGRGIDAQMRESDMDFSLGQRGQDVDFERAVLAALGQALGIEAGQRGDELRYATTLNENQRDDYYRMLQLAMQLPGFAQQSQGFQF